ncbi:methionyl-tRNA formyltransferase [Desulfovibrio sp. OttesenSCG-928-M14]|nr:methionyl-tRNA formyltransferase [Desulfovibrio sp. OttesenSCG-928-M14]
MADPFEKSPEDCQGSGKSTLQLEAEKTAAQKPSLRLVFMGTPDFAADILASLLKASFITVAAVYCQPDRPAGRGKKLQAPPVKQLALEHGLPVFQPQNFKADPAGDAAWAQLSALTPDVLAVAAYGLVLPQRVLDIARLMPVNVHASLLPKYRGAAPIQRAIMAGEAVTGVTIMRMEAGLDTGPILMQRAVGIDLNDNSADLHNELAREGADLLLLALERLSAGTLHAIRQDEALATYAHKLTKEESRLNLDLPARALHARIRGLCPWPGARLNLVRPGKEDLQVLVEPGVFPLHPDMKMAVDAFVESLGGPPVPGTIIGLSQGALLVACADGAYAFTRLRPAAGKSMDAAAFANGYLAGGEAMFT